MWARFMKVATRDDKPDWQTAPAGVTTATVCRLSGKLATDGCQDVEVVSNNGLVERRSMVYTEYFARGTAPESYCDLHPTHGILTKLAGVFGAGPAVPPPVAVASTGLPPAPAGTSGTTAPPEIASAPEPPKKKRGFWSRVFGLGKEPPKDRKK
jgi:hypothetical protein